ncbi:methyl-accepting chemotaxis protein [Vibrio lentus]|uniref:Chemotaxis protein n=1 Tax=Vibrio lentus TaxID=136468 RepID=A0AA45AB29_9VIBR|nr:methyl-accepting chemotaxis protein [Vibrio lentus]MCB5361030.1 methyl-accepting chemotaxis protein [Vibrio lentus]MCB5451748.1 methyl-accepting chemotaxis protein [Vibrio lentus]MCB5462765.1 methyl-accepting chemotaxis protein [Vibrio lentus]MCC4792219.1 methyl-accepting chemotaxis protein [Vibrio lentus]MCC4850244.1 methyl-accepting chemotaxis protein [Vibrio lentus]
MSINNLSIKSKIAIPLMVIVIVFSTVTVLNVIKSNAQAAINHELNNVVQPVLDNLEDGYRDIYQVISSAQGLLLAKDQAAIDYQKFEFKDNAYKAVPRFESVLTLYSAGVLDPSSRGEVTKLVDAMSKWVALHEPLFADPENAHQYNIDYSPALDAEFAIIREQLRSVRSLIEAKQIELRKQANESIESSKMIIEIGMGVAILAAIFALWLSNRFIVKPIQNVEKAMAEIASGDGDLSQRMNVEGSDEIARLSSAFNQFVGKIHVTIEQVIITSNAVRAEMENIKSLTQGVAEFSSNQQKESEVVAAAVHEMQATSEAVSGNALEAASASNTANREVESADKTLGLTVSSIERLAHDIENASGVVHELDSDVKNIASILGVIRGIAEQTNLLALNAAIEAARAGEQGRGFAVVADEVRALASKTQDSTGEIQSMIERLEVGAKQAVGVMNESKVSGEKTIVQAGTAASSLSEIRNSIGMMNEMNTQIATAASQQSQVSEEVNKNVQRIAESTVQMVEMASSAENACMALAEQCEALDSLVSQFEV